LPFSKYQKSFAILRYFVNSFFPKRNNRITNTYYLSFVTFVPIIQSTIYQTKNRMKKILLLTLATAAMLIGGYKMVAQPTTFYTNLTSTTTPAAVNSRFALTDLGAFRQTRFQTTATPAPAIQTYAFHIGTPAAPNYNPCWRPYNTGDATGIGYALNTIVVSSSVVNSARYNTSGGGVDGNLSALANNTYYTVNTQENATANNLSAIWATAFNPVSFSTITQAPAVTQVTATDGVKVFITTSAAPAIGENVFLRYSTNNFLTSSAVQFTFSGTSGSAVIPAQPLSTVVRYYVFSTNQSAAQLTTLAGTAGILQNAYDMATLNFNNNAGANYSYTVVAPQPFITEWITTDGTLTIPTFTGLTYNYNVSYRILPAGLPTVLTGQTGDVNLTGLTNGSTYEISITGTFPSIYFNGDATNSPKIRNIKQWGSIAWSTMQNAFGEAVNTNIGCSNLTSNATDVPNLSNVTSLGETFAYCSAFNGGNVANWNTSNITRMPLTFARASAFNQDISSWNTANVTDMYGMFNGATSFNQNISTWNTTNVADMYGMFAAATIFNQPISVWNTQNCTNMQGMFSGATAFNQPISTWNTQNVTNMSWMFSGATAFNQPIGTWSTQNVINMREMFANATAFNQSLANWNVTNLEAWFLSGATNMLNSCGMSAANYDATLIGWAAQNVKTGVWLGAVGRNYCAGAAARATLISSKNWVISGDAISGTCPTITSLTPTSG
jgi:surface protein